MKTAHCWLLTAIGLLALFAGCRPKDTEAPAVSFIFPTDGDSLPLTAVRVRARAVDNVRVARVEFLVDDSLAISDSAGKGDTFGFVWDDTKDSLGPHLLRARAFDADTNMSEAKARVLVCRDTGVQTHHAGAIDSNETWYPTGNPHIVDRDVWVENGVTLTVKPGCVVRFDSATWLYCGFGDPGSIVAEGTPDSLITFTAHDTTPKRGDWGGIDFSPLTMPGTHLRYCLVEYGGDHSDFGEVHVDGTNARIEDCVIRKSGDRGIVCETTAGFDRFARNTVTECASYPVRIGCDFARTLEAGDNLQGNDRDGCEVLGGDVRTSGAWPDIGVPYVITGDIRIGDYANAPVLTIAPGCNLRFLAYTGLYVGYWESGALQADGATFAGTRPDIGVWKSVTFEDASIDSLCWLRNCRVEYGGWIDSADIRIHNAQPNLSGNSIDHSLAYGIYLDGNVSPNPDSLLRNNSFYQDSLGPIRR